LIALQTLMKNQQSHVKGVLKLLLDDEILWKEAKKWSRQPTTDRDEFAELLAANWHPGERKTC
jgi:hypothetical protein